MPERGDGPTSVSLPPERAMSRHAFGARPTTPFVEAEKTSEMLLVQLQTACPPPRLSSLPPAPAAQASSAQRRTASSDTVYAKPHACASPLTRPARQGPRASDPLPSYVAPRRQLRARLHASQSIPHRLRRSLDRPPRLAASSPCS